MPSSPPEQPRDAGGLSAVVTGGRGGLGAGVASELERSGWVVAAPGREELDVADPDSVSRYFDGRGAVELLVNCAGSTLDRPIVRMSESDWDRVVRANLDGAFFCSRAVLASMATRRRGGIINIGSYSALNGPPGQANYAAAKAGLIGLTKALAREWGRRNIRVNCVLPGFLDTKMTAALPPARRDEVLADHVLGRLTTVGEAARFVAALASMGHVSGQVFQLDSRVGRW